MTNLKNSYGRSDHPRSRGVYCVAVRVSDGAPGSSPLARGLHYYYNEIGLESGIIPARAGFTSPNFGGAAQMGDHPRSRGVYDHVNTRNTFYYGSSPLARGLPSSLRTSPRRRGIIPARAGFTNIVRVGKAWSGDHPRSRGVYGHTDASPPQGAGSSPLARGLRVRRLRDAGGCWIIPARAGFTAPSGCYTRYPGDHFRSRGVYHLLKCCCNEGLWIIPARAGFTS